MHRGHNKNEVTRRARHLPSIYVQGNTWSRDGQEWKWNMICDPRASDARAGLTYKYRIDRTSDSTFLLQHVDRSSERNFVIADEKWRIIRRVWLSGIKHHWTNANSKDRSWRETVDSNRTTIEIFCVCFVPLFPRYMGNLKSELKISEEESIRSILGEFEE